ncbi:MAG: CocE/NonD family hydrolase [Flavobacteriales bacterium]|nr:CocE/NonD family hydrolase [Flavobacteriales bacterium]MDW8431499.1 CocE/NonD family hydrolase [Flavobacteriales bacterium]
MLHSQVILNGKIDGLEELVTKTRVMLPMPDGVRLATDIYQPILRDCVLVDINVPIVNQTFKLPILPRGQQILVYDQLNGQPNPNPYKLPMVFMRTPYGIGDFDEISVPVCILGYNYAVQDNRGRYASEGVYLPLHSDSWKKGPYHPDHSHVLDVTSLSDPRNGNNHEDGANAIQALLNLDWSYDLDGDGIKETTDKLSTGRIGMFGASAMGYSQYQAAAARKIDPSQPGLKCLLPIVATQEFYKSTGYHNGCFRDQLVNGWLKGMIFTGCNDDLIDQDNSIDNALHTAADYGLPNKFEAARRAIDHFSVVRYGGGPAGYYPNAVGRKDMDASRAPVNALGESDPNGAFSRYTNMEVPAYHLTGWWDIFIDGQIETWALMKKHLNPNGKAKRLQKLVIGPWAHQTMGSRKTGDITYPENVGDILGFALDDFSSENFPISKAVESEAIGWFRFNLNYDSTEFLGEPKARLPKSNTWINLGIVSVKIPGQDYLLSFNDLLSFLNGAQGLSNVPIKVKENLLNNELDFTVNVPALGSPIIPEFDGGTVPSIPFHDFNQIKDVRFYMAGPVDDGIPENANLGNYWVEADTFPIKEDIEWHNFYLHQNGRVDQSPPTQDEGFRMILHDPDNPVRTVGGGNMIEKFPDGSEVTQGQCNLVPWASYTLDHPGVIQFETEVLSEPLSVVGFPQAVLYAKSNPAGLTSGPTSTEFYVRVVDEYPDGSQYFVFEGGINARARHYARSVALGQEDDNAPWENIEIGEIYEYHFQMFPIAYVFGKGHKMRVLISSSNYRRFQSDANLPLMPGEFFRRSPGDGRTYNYMGVEMAPRIAVNRVHFSPEHPSHLKLPVFKGNLVNTPPVQSALPPADDLLIYPNPSSDIVHVAMPYQGKWNFAVVDMQGRQITQGQVFQDLLNLEVSRWPSGIYCLRLVHAETGVQAVGRIVRR